MRKTYKKSFKVKVYESILNKKKTVGSVAKEYSIARPIIFRWLAKYKKYQDNAFTGRGNRLPGKAKLYALEKENEQLKEELEILKKFEEFAKNPKD